MRATLIVTIVCFAACESDKPRFAPPPPVVAPPTPPAIDAPLPDAAPAPPVVDAAPPPDAEAPYVMTPLDRINAVPVAMATKDGKLVLLRIVDDDGARGDPNLAFELRDRSDRTTKRQVVLALDETLSDAKHLQRIAAAEKLIAAHALAPVPLLVPGDDKTFEGEGLTIDTRRGRIVIEQGTQQLLDRAMPATWKSKSYVDKLEGITCTNPEFVRTAYAAPAKKLVVLEVAYEGTDSCWAPSARLHVVSW